MRRVFFFLAAVWTVLAATSTHARTIRLARDGSGEFSVLWEAIEAAEAGDVLSLAPGRYGEMKEYSLPGGNFTILGYVTQSELAIVGDDRDTVIIGPETFVGDDPYQSGIILGIGTDVTIENVTIENVADGVDASGDGVTMRNCLVQDCGSQGLDSLALFRTYVIDCEFRRNRYGIIVFQGLDSTGVLITNSVFVDQFLGGIQLQVRDCVVSSCRFEGGRGGVTVVDGASSTVASCTFLGQEIIGLGAVSAAVLVTDCEFTGGQANIDVGNEAHVAGSGNILNGGTFATINTVASCSFDFSGNHILNAGGHSVRAVSGPPPPCDVDLTGNYWGTADPAQIETWIFDRNDDPLSQHFVVYAPFEAGPVSVEPSSFGRTKAQYAPRD